MDQSLPLKFLIFFMLSVFEIQFKWNNWGVNWARDELLNEGIEKMYITSKNDLFK